MNFAIGGICAISPFDDTNVTKNENRKNDNIICSIILFVKYFISVLVNKLGVTYGPTLNKKNIANDFIKSSCLAVISLI